MSAAPILTALGIAGIVTTVAVAFMPILFADMRRAVKRGLRHDGKTDATALTLMIFGLLLMGAAGVGSVWLGANWS
ncbi:hypothetical protein [Methylobacterium sp. Leaf91]|uniref:hypothetical protein n=1 Tax=Methylobacterium sp. Leaf91 TaxID=1736247 RepID=UPI0006F79A1B|nr:hypothetical protein [Methylobacterium sp. Leaf91]KQO94615.1 hypothetical protein ASF32_19050 [Methylobacterium sp. Leaf91]